MKTFFELRERTLTKGEMKKREKIAKDLPDAEFKKRYGDDWMSVKMGTATNMAKKEDVRADRLAALKKQYDDKKKQDDANLSKVRYATIMKRKGYNEALDPNNHKHVMSVMYNTKNSEEGIAAIKKKFGVDHKKANDMMDKAIDHQTKNEAVDPDETGGEAETHMAMNQVKQMRHYLDGIERMVKSEGDMEEWIQNKMTKATDYLKSVYGYKTGSQNEGKVNELSRDTLGSYIKKASDASKHRGMPTKKVDNRYSGVSKASKKIDKMDEAMTFAVSVEGLPQMFLNGNSPGEIKQNLRKMFKQPSMIQSVKRVTPHDVKKVFRMKAQGKDED